ncbi:MAG: DMT family transporter [Chthoniobacterales bacterium]
MNGRALWRGRLALAAAVVIWSTPAVFQFWLARTFDPWTQNFYRYAAGFLTMLPFLAVAGLRPTAELRSRDVLGCLVVAVPNVIHQVAQTVAVVLLWPGVFALLGRSSVIITAVLAIVFFADERWIARSVKFQIGTLLGLVAVAGMIWQPDDGGMLSTTGLLLALVASCSWAAYGILVKKFTARAGPTFGFAMVSFFTAALLLPLALFFGEPGTIFEADSWTVFILLASGALSIGIGHWLYYIGIRRLGAAPSQAALLLCPLGTVCLSSLLFGETFRAGQMVFGGILLFGAFLALSARPPAAKES